MSLIIKLHKRGTKSIVNYSIVVIDKSKSRQFKDTLGYYLPFRDNATNFGNKSLVFFDQKKINKWLFFGAKISGAKLKKLIGFMNK
jgi:ribosomal protein S16